MEPSDSETTIVRYPEQTGTEEAIASFKRASLRNMVSQGSMFIVARISLFAVSMLALVLYIIGTPV